MSNARFTPITSDLLARKGDASPSAIKPSLFWRRPPAAEPPRPAPAQDLRVPPAEPRDLRSPALVPPNDFRDAEGELVPALPPIVSPEGLPRPHKMMVTLSHSDYEKLGIAAVKKGITRQQMLRVAVDLHIERLKREFGGCACMAMGGTGACGEGCGAH